MKLALRGTIFLAIGVELTLVLLAALAKVVIPLWVMLIPPVANRLFSSGADYHFGVVISCD